MSGAAWLKKVKATAAFAFDNSESMGMYCENVFMTLTKKVVEIPLSP